VCIEVSNPWGIEGFMGPDWPLLLAMAMALPAAVSVFVRWRRSVGVERQQMKWFFLAVVGLLVAFLIAFADFNQALNEILFATGLTGVWVSIAVAVLKFRLYDIDRIISRTVTYALVVGLLVGGVAAAATLAGAQFEEPWVVAATTLAVAAAFNPLRRRIQRWVDRRFNRSRYDTEQVMDGFAESLREEVDSKHVIEGFLEVVGDTLQPVGIGMWVRDR
jgi:peptidoglycan/LPS O-acetylase OafA/YrhL